MIALTTLVTGTLNRLVNILLPRVKAAVKRRLRGLNRCGHKVRKLVVLKPRRLVVQIAVPLLKVRLHGGLQRFLFLTVGGLRRKGFKLCVSLLQTVARGRHQRFNVIRRITQRG